MNNINLRMSLKDCSTELRRLGLERLLTDVYKRKVTLVKLLEEQSVPPDIIESLKLRNMGMVVDRMIEYVRQSVSNTNGGERRFKIIERYYGLDGNMPAPLSAMSAKYGITRERVRQLKDRSLFGLRTGAALLAFEATAVDSARRCHRIDFTPLPPPPVEPANAPESAPVLMSHDEHLRLDPERKSFSSAQKAALSACLAGKSVAISGCAGSGKTLVCLALASAFSESGKRTLVTCFTRSLGNHLDEMLVEKGNVTVASFHALCLRLGIRAGLPVPGGWTNRVWSEKFPELLENAVKKCPELRFDRIIVDDAQDFHDRWWEALRACMSGDDAGLYYCIDDNDLVRAQARQLPLVERVCFLQENRRSPSALKHLLSACYRSSSSMTLRNPVSDPPEFYICRDEEEMRRTVGHVFDDMLSTMGLEPGEIAVLTPRLPKYSVVYGARLRRGLKLVVRNTQVRNHSCLSRIGTFRGLERRGIILVDIDGKFANQGREDRMLQLYQALTRCTGKVVVVGTEAGWHCFNELRPTRYPGMLLPPQVVAESGVKPG
ncbi:MAG: AAA family ATPase [Candidatus Obscuribacterales bacterium]